MTSLMSIFDPSFSMLPYLGWVVIALSAMPMKLFFWKTDSSFSFMSKKLTFTLLMLFKTQKSIMMTLFFFVLNMNLLGLFPLVFSPTSHFSFNFMIAMVLWLGMMMWYVNSNLTQLLSHLTPVGSPLVLAPILVLIETVSSLIRPLTLSLRLMANIMAGHMILTLVSKGVFSLTVLVKAPLLVVLGGLMMFEFGVALVQAYVFSSLMALYWEESESSH